jgi:hypothetical protein
MNYNRYFVKRCLNSALMHLLSSMFLVMMALIVMVEYLVLIFTLYDSVKNRIEYRDCGINMSCLISNRIQYDNFNETFIINNNHAMNYTYTLKASSIALTLSIMLSTMIIMMSISKLVFNIQFMSLENTYKRVQDFNSKVTSVKETNGEERKNILSGICSKIRIGACIGKFVFFKRALFWILFGQIVLLSLFFQLFLGNVFIVFQLFLTIISELIQYPQLSSYGICPLTTCFNFWQIKAIRILYYLLWFACILPTVRCFYKFFKLMNKLKLYSLNQFIERELDLNNFDIKFKDEFIYEFLNYEGLFLLREAKTNVNESVFNEIKEELWKNYNNHLKYTKNRHDVVLNMLSLNPIGTSNDSS